MSTQPANENEATLFDAAQAYELLTVDQRILLGRAALVLAMATESEAGLILEHPLDDEKLAEARRWEEANYAAWEILGAILGKLPPEFSQGNGADLSVFEVPA